MASRLGTVTGLGRSLRISHLFPLVSCDRVDLAQHCRMLLYNRPKHTKLIRYAVLYPLYAISEFAIVSTDLAELLGSATALVMLFPELPLWVGVLITSVDVFLILAFCNPTRGKPVKLFEGMITALVLTVFVCLLVVIIQVSPNWGDAFFGFVPSSTLGKPGAIYTCKPAPYQPILKTNLTILLPSNWHRWSHYHASWSVLRISSFHSRSCHAQEPCN